MFPYFIDVGGGSVKNSTRHTLARISLRWMIRECFKANTGIMFNSQRLRSVGLDPSALYPFISPRLPPLSSEKIHTIAPIPQKKSKLHRVLASCRKLIPRNTGSTFDSITLGTDSLEGSKEKDNEKTRILSEEEEDLEDVLSPKYDQLKITPFWWILEVIPMQFRYQRKCDDWVSYFGFVLLRFLGLVWTHSIFRLTLKI